MGAFIFLVAFIPFSIIGLALLNIYVYGWDAFLNEIKKPASVGSTNKPM
ncbi:hypothetical protein [Bacillus sp. FJAT-50079]|nr:hypothetical protein [Bacillus sp. FJAT-50079]MBS4207472.1 hypothetical protein [Bacillus sp. FJAT-50079]